jgi:hypothetical protein
MLSRALALSEGKIDASTPDLEHARLNAYIESFCIHARTLIEFFTKSGRDELCAQRFAVKTYSPLDKTTLKSFNQKLNTQIAHVIYHGRTSNEADKIRGTERRQMALALKHEVTHFKTQRRPEFMNVDLPDVELHTIGQSPPSATNAIQITSPKPPSQ